MKQLDSKYVWKYFLTSVFSLFFLFILVGFMVVLPFISDHESNYYQSKTMETTTQSKKNIYCMAIIISIVFIISVILAWVFAKLSYRFYKYELRDEGFRKESGVIWKSYNTIPYGRIQNIDIYRGVIDRILGLSRLDIHTAGNNSPHFSEGRLPGLSVETAQQLQEELVKRVNDFRSSGGV